MFRAISEIAVAIMVTSVTENPRSSASWWPALRASTMSSGLSMLTTMSPATIAPDRRFATQQAKALFEIQRGVHVVERQPQLDHGKSHLWLQTHDHSVCAAQPGHMRDGPQRSGGEGIHHIDGGDIDDDALRAEPADSLHQVVPKPFGLGVGQCGLHRCDENRALFQDGDWHGVLALIVSTRWSRRCE